MKYLLDTHTLIWYLDGDLQLSTKAKNCIEDKSNSCFVSVATIWEITIKTSLGRLQTSSNLSALEKGLAELNIELVQFEYKHFSILQKLPFHHGDPFDRMIIAQGISEKHVIITKDRVFKKYKAPTLW